MARTISAHQLKNWRITTCPLTFGTRMAWESPILAMRTFSVTCLLCQHIGRIRKPAPGDLIVGQQVQGRVGTTKKSTAAICVGERRERRAASARGAGRFGALSLATVRAAAS